MPGSPVTIAGSTWLPSMLIMLITTAVLLAVAAIALRRQDIGRRAAFQ